MDDEGLEETDGVKAKAVIIDQLIRAFGVIRQHDPHGSIRSPTSPIATATTWPS